MKIKNIESYQANVHSVYQRNREEFTKRAWKTLQKNFGPMDKKNDYKGQINLALPTPIWYNTNIKQKEEN